MSRAEPKTPASVMTEAPSGSPPVASLPRFFSPSAASTYDKCPRRWKHRYVDKLPDPPGEAALVGTFSHRVLELLCGEEPSLRTIERAQELARDVWPSISAHRDYRALNLEPEAEREFRWKSWRAIEGLWGLENPTLVDVRSTEQRLTAEVAGVPFRGIVDRMDNTDAGLAITDYKSGKAPMPNRRLEALSQVLLYAAAVEADTGERPVQVRLLYLGQEAIEETVTDEGLAAATGGLASSWASLETDCSSGRFEVRPGPLCGWCPYVEICKEGRSEVVRRVKAGRMRKDAPARAALGI